MAMSMSRPDPASPASVADASFGTARRGFDQGQVRDFLRMVAAELGRMQERERFLERELRVAQSNPDLDASNLDDAALTRLLGEETARVLGTARESAREIREKAEESAARMLAEASEEVARIREQADLDASRMRADATADAESEIEMAKQQGREMVTEARAYRERVLSELARRRELAREQIEQLIHGRDRLIQAFERARLAAVDVVSELEPLGEPSEYVNLTPTTGPVPVMVANVRPEPGEATQALPRTLDPTEEAGADVDGAAGGQAADASDGEAGAADVVGADAPDGEEADADGAMPVAEETADSGDDAGDDVDAAAMVAETEATDDGEAADDGESMADDATTIHDEESGDGDSVTTPEVPAADGSEDAPDEAATDDLAVDDEPAVDDASVVAESADDEHDAVDDEPAVDDASVVAESADDEHDAVDDEPAATDADEGDDGEERDDVVVDLFARLRAGSHGEAPEADDPAPDDAAADESVTEPVADADDPASDDAAPDESVTEPVADADEPATASATVVGDVDAASTDDDLDDGTAEEDTPFRRRDAELTPLIVASARKLKRVLADEQNGALEVLRRDAGVGALDELVPPRPDQAASYLDAIEGELTEAAAAGARSIGGDGKRLAAREAKAARAAAAEIVVDWLVQPLRDRLERCVDEGDGDNLAIARRVRSVYREWKTQHIDEQLDDVLRTAFGRGALGAAGTSTALLWQVDSEHAACPDCDDNSLSPPVTAGDEFPTGHTFAPAHPGCRCVLTVADR